MDGHMDSSGTQQQQQQQQRQREGAAVGVGRLNTSTYYSLHYCRQLHNPLRSHYWFPCMLRLSVTPLPQMNRELTSHDPWDCCLFLACVTCYEVLYVLMCGVLCVAWCGGAWCVVAWCPFSRASSPADLWPLSNLPGRVFDGVSSTHHTYLVVLRLIRYE